MKFVWSTLYVRDLTASVHFYEAFVGLPLMKQFQAGPDTVIAFLGDGETQIELIQETGRTPSSTGSDISWGFAVDSLDEVYAKAKAAGLPIDSEPEQPTPNTKFFFVRDPDGLRIQFVEQL